MINSDQPQHWKDLLKLRPWSRYRHSASGGVWHHGISGTLGCMVRASVAWQCFLQVGHRNQGVVLPRGMILCWGSVSQQRTDISLSSPTLRLSRAGSQKFKLLQFKAVLNKHARQSALGQQRKQQQQFDRLHSPATISAEKLPTTQNPCLRLLSGKIKLSVFLLTKWQWQL